MLPSSVVITVYLLLCVIIISVIELYYKYISYFVVFLFGHIGQFIIPILPLE
jgi:hypothetical protein